MPEEIYIPVKRIIEKNAHFLKVEDIEGNIWEIIDTLYNKAYCMWIYKTIMNRLKAVAEFYYLKVYRNGERIDGDYLILYLSYER